MGGKKGGRKISAPGDLLRHCGNHLLCWMEEIQCTGRPTAPIITRYRCFLPDLAGLAGLRRVGPGTGTILSLKTLLRPHRHACIRAKLAHTTLHNYPGVLSLKVIDIICHPDRLSIASRWRCHPDRSAAEWRDLLFVRIDTHATRCDSAPVLETVP